MKYLRFKNLEYVKRRIELGKAVYGSMEYVHNSISYNKYIVLYQKEGKYVFFIEVYNNKYVPEEGNFIREEKIIFETIEEVLEYLKKESITLDNLYYK